MVNSPNRMHLSSIFCCLDYHLFVDHGRPSRNARCLGPTPFLKTYTHLLLCFPFPNHSDRQKAINALQIAIHRMILAFPWLGDCVLHHGITAASSGMFTTASHRAPVVPEILAVKDHLEMLRPIKTSSPPKMQSHHSTARFCPSEIGRAHV